MLIRFFYPRWGSHQIPWDVFLSKVKALGYYGVEIAIPEDQSEWECLISLLADYDLKFIAQHCETEESDFLSHRERFEYHLKRIAKTKPLFINSHTGKDYFSQQQNIELLDLASQISVDYGVNITHETHRGRFSFAAHVLNDYLTIKSTTKLSLDISHWFCVAESMLLDQEKSLKLAINHTAHIHARIGHAQGPQVNNPAAPEWKDVIERHLQIWNDVVVERKKQGAKHIDITTEFGPMPYAPSAPFSQRTFISQWEANTWMMNTLKNIPSVCEFIDAY